MLGVPKGKLTTWSNLRLRAIDPAVAEVNALSDYVVAVTPVKTGRSVTHVELRWWKKDDEGQGAAARALEFSKVGRKARATGQAETVVAASGLAPASDPTSAPNPAPAAAPAPKPRPAWLAAKGPALAAATYETARLRHPGYDIYAIEGEWRRWATGKSPAKDPDRAFLAFLRKYAEAHPL